MQRFRYALLLAAGAGFFLFQSRPISVYAASSAQAAQDGTVSGKPGANAYEGHCAICHGEQREGILPAFPPLVGIQHQKTDQQIIDLIHTGKGRMPGFPKLQGGELTALVHYLSTPALSASDSASDGNDNSSSVHSSGMVDAGKSLFQQNCAFCHGRDAMGGETGPDLTRSKLVLADVKGDKISEVVRDGRPEKKMPAFNFSSQEVLSLASYIHSQETKAASMKGGRRGVDVADLQTGNAAMGKTYFNGAGTCAKCHSATGDLAGIAKRFEGLQLEMRMLYPREAKSHVDVTLPSGAKLAGTLVYQDEFVIGMRDESGIYHSWKTRNVKFHVDSPVDAHVDLFSKYTDDDIHNLMAYLQTLR
ncbi:MULTISPECIES: cytochrome c [Acidobacteriaceae]|uniref:cytochrome c n=1 Tax=Acidobacteriaceae TaxID=204434 RepID=UPI00131CE78D|nr:MULTISPECIES: c-type cytochrome [Acidobacteriaceae]MDW5267310.1 c-type cytochrome [Edaphobacter sp.]